MGLEEQRETQCESEIRVFPSGNSSCVENARGTPSAVLSSESYVKSVEIDGETSSAGDVMTRKLKSL